MFRLTIADLLDGIPIEAEEDRTRVAKNNRRVRRYQELRMSGCREVVDDLQERELSLRRQGGLRRIQNVDPLLEPIGE